MRAMPLSRRATQSLAALPAGARIGTSSLRRQSQLRHHRPDLEVVVMRGNVDTRIAKLDAGACEATVLAVAGLERLGLESRIRVRLAPSDMLPAIAQGIVGVECLTERDDIVTLVRPLEHDATRSMLAAERAFAAKIGASCHSPIAGYATLDGGTLRLDGLVGSPDGRSIIVDSVSGAAGDAATIGAELADRLLAAGAGELL